MTIDATATAGGLRGPARKDSRARRSDRDVRPTRGGDFPVLFATFVSEPTYSLPLSRWAASGPSPIKIASAWRAWI